MISITEAERYQHAMGPDLFALCQAAASVRDRHWGSTLTFSKKVFIPLTNMCRDSCGYCTFVQAPDSASANYLTPEQVMATTLEGERVGCKEALFSLGERPEARYPQAREWLAKLGYRSTVDYLKSQCENVLAHSSLLPHVNAGALSKAELAALKPVAPSMGMMLENITVDLLKKGQAHHACPDKTPKRRLATLVAAGQLDIAFTTGILIGIGESWQDRIHSLAAIRELHMQYGHIQEVIIQNFRAKPGTKMAGCTEPDLDDMKRTIAVARLLLPADISIQAPPNLTNEYSAYVRAGINDWGGISPITKDFINPERAWPQIASVAEACQASGYQLAERLTIYPAFYQSPTTPYLTPSLYQRVQRCNARNNICPGGLVA